MTPTRKLETNSTAWKIMKMTCFSEQNTPASTDELHRGGPTPWAQRRQLPGPKAGPP
jgi:hypothetical protein